MYILKYFFLSLFAMYAYARPPRDLILMPPPRAQGIRVIRNKHITFTNEQPDQIVKDQILTLHTVKGRSRPDRSGRVLSVIQPRSIVIPFKASQDKKWIALTVKKSGIRVWVPKVALPPLDSNFKKIGSNKKKKTRSQKSSASSVVDDEETDAQAED
jgi:hypothetical protein